MELLKQLLSADKIVIPNLDDEVRGLGYNPDNLSQDDAQAAFKKLKASYSNKAIKPGKKANNGALSKEVVTEKAASDILKMRQTYENMADEAAERNAKKIVAILQNIPNLSMEKVRDMIGDSEGDLDFFLHPIEDVKEAFFSKFDID